MALPLLTTENLEYFQEKLNALSADTPRQWGELEATRMVHHLRFVAELSLGEAKSDEIRDISWPVARTLMRWAFFHVITTWPKGKLKAPAYFTPESDDSFEDERQALLALLERFVDELETTPETRNLSPLFGRLTLTQWSRVHGVHFNHHFRQFGLV
jgi:hypothetical protein